MRLTLQNGYPCPLPPGFDFDAHNPHMHFVGFDGVRHFEWLHTLTIEFDTQEGARGAEVNAPRAGEIYMTVEQADVLAKALKKARMHDIKPKDQSND